MKKEIFINESQLNILENSEEITFFRFFKDTKEYLKELLSGNIKAVPSQTLRLHGLTSKTLESKLIKQHILTKKEDVREVFDKEKGKQVSMYYAIYSVPKKNFVKNMRRLYSKLFEK